MRHTVLIVEDSEDDAEILKMLFQEAGVANPFVMVHSGEKAVAYLQGNPPYQDRAKYPLPGVILLDLKMPVMNGFEFLEWLKIHPQFGDIPIIALSGHGELQTIRRAYELGATSFLTKPMRLADLENLIQGYPNIWIQDRDSTPPPLTSDSAVSEL